MILDLIIFAAGAAAYRFGWPYITAQAAALVAKIKARV